jgi:hypothetical protein
MILFSKKPNGSGLFDEGFDATKRDDPFDFEDSLSAYDFDRFKLTPHIAKEFIEYDHRNLPLRSSVFSGDQTQAIVVTEYVYNALGQLVGLRKSHQGIHECEPNGSGLFDCMIMSVMTWFASVAGTTNAKTTSC